MSKPSAIHRFLTYPLRAAGNGAMAAPAKLRAMGRRHRLASERESSRRERDAAHDRRQAERQAARDDAHEKRRELIRMRKRRVRA
jgi:hypothetical protein